MKRNIYSILIALIVLGLTACQANPVALTQIPSTEFFKDQPERWLSIRPPSGWTAKPGGTSTTPSIVVSDDWPGYEKTDPTAVGIVILPLTDQGSAEQVLQISIGRFQDMLTKPTGKVILEQAAGQSYAWVEYLGKSAEKDNEAAYYFMAVISTERRSVLVFASVATNQQERIRPAFQSLVKAVTLH